MPPAGDIPVLRQKQYFIQEDVYKRQAQDVTAQSADGTLKSVGFNF